MNETIKSKKLIFAVVLVGIFIIALSSFAIGVVVGFSKAKFSYRFGENYERNFMAPPPGMAGGPMGGMKEKFRDFEGRDFRNSHGLAGKIVSIMDNSLVIKDRDNKENSVAVSDKTIIKSGRDDIKLSDLKNDDQIVIMGTPGDSGIVNAELIRVFSIVDAGNNIGN